MRAVWLTTVYNIDWPSSQFLSAKQQQTEMCDILDSLKSANFNTIMFQVRARGDLLYPSLIEPWGKSVSGTLGQDPGYNVLKFVIEEAHKRGIEVHAWFVTYKVADGKSLPPVSSPLHITRSHPEWCKQYNDNGNYAWWLDPGIPDVKNYLKSIVMEIVRSYNIDGIHFDYIRYPDTDFDDAATFSKYGGGRSLSNWRRNNINEFVYEVYDSIISVKPDIKVGSAPIGIYKNIPKAFGWQGFSDIYQDSRKWLAEGKHDYICPQIYWDIANPPSDPSFPALVKDWVKNSSHRHVYPGIAAYRMSVNEKNNEYTSRRIKKAKNNWPASEIMNEIDTSRALGGLGQTFFSSNEICSNQKNVFTLLKNKQYQNPANIPSMPWKDKIPPNAIQNLTITDLDSLNYLISWNPPVFPVDGDTVKYYNIYKDTLSSVDISDIKKISQFHLKNSLSALIQFPSPPSSSVHFTITAYDNGYNESFPSSEVNTSICKHNSIFAGNWQTQDFNVSFFDSAFLHVDKRFYQVMDFDGLNWNTNPDFGFFNDSFQQNLRAEWHTVTGKWDTSSTYLLQSDKNENNGNIYSYLKQDTSCEYLYQWKMNIGGKGQNRRAGFHFFCDDGKQPERNNSYLVYFRVDHNRVQIYKYTANNMFLAADDVCKLNTDIWYDCKIIFEPKTGEIGVFLNNNLVSTWTDSIPFKTGNSISLRTGECIALFDDVKVFKSRGIKENILTGNQEKEVRFQNMSPLIPACQIQSVTTTPEGYFSRVESQKINIDWTPPLAFQVADENYKDSDTVMTSSSLSAVWTQSVDSNSGIVKYLYAFGTQPGDSDIVAWTENALDTIANSLNLNLINNIQYFCSVKAVNGAGLFTISVSDGVRVVLAPIAAFTVSDSIICEGNLVSFSNTSENADLFQWKFTGGYPEISTQFNPVVLYDTSGVYNVALEVEGSSGIDTLVKKEFIHVNARPQALFFADDSMILMPNTFATFTNISKDATSYHWDFGDGYTSTDENPWHLYLTEGDFTVKLIAFNNLCGADTFVKKNYIHITNPNILAGNLTNVFINVMPNPVEERSLVYFEIASDSNVSLTLCDILGKEIVLQNNKKIDQGIHIVSLSHVYPKLSRGLYYIKLTVDNKTTVIKVTL